MNYIYLKVSKNQYIISKYQLHKEIGYIHMCYVDIISKLIIHLKKINL